MAYSNINKDKIQANTGKKFKTAILTVILAGITVSSGSNIVQQISTLREATRRNGEMEKNIEIIEKENADLSKKIVMATESGTMNRKIREYLGLGNKDDHWIIADLAPVKNDEKEKIKVVEVKPNIVQWWEVFTK